MGTTSRSARSLQRNRNTKREGEHQLKNNLLLIIASLLSILFMTLHLADDIARGFEKGGLSNLTAVPILVIWLYGTLVLAERRSGYVIILLGSILGSGVPVIHFMRTGGVLGGEIGKSGGDLFFVWTLIALGVTAVFSVILSARALLGWRRPR